MDMGYGRGQHVRVNMLNIIFYVKHTINLIDMHVNADILSESRWGTKLSLPT